MKISANKEICIRFEENEIRALCYTREILQKVLDTVINEEDINAIFDVDPLTKDLIYICNELDYYI